MAFTSPRDYLSLYVEATGVSEVPPVFHLFAGLSTLAAAVADRVWFQRDATGKRLYPNLYIFLIGPSGSGKEYAITNAAKLINEIPDTGLFMSTGITKQYIIDELDKKHHSHTPHILYLVTEELGMSVHSKEVGRDLIKFMTGNYIPSGLPIQEGTRTHGGKTVPPNACVTGDTEILTTSGWIRFDNLEGTSVETLQWNPQNAQLTWHTCPIVKLAFNGKLLGWKEELYDGIFTPDHTIPVFAGRGRRYIRARKAGTLSSLQEWQTPISGFATGGATHCPDFLRLIAAIQADGHIYKSLRITSFGLSKQRKIDRLHRLCYKLGVSIEERAPQHTRQFIIRGPLVQWCNGLLMREGIKQFGAWLLDFTVETWEAFLDELVWWDGHESRSGGTRNGYSSRLHQNVCWVQTLAHLTGRSCYVTKRPSAWYLTIRETSRTTIYQKQHTSQLHNGYVYCLKTNTGYFLARRNNTIFITGNCLNWLAGTTDDWLVEAVEKSAVMGGFFARVLSVRGRRSGDVRYAEIQYPPNYQEMRDALRLRLDTYAKMKACFVKTNAAAAYYKDWYESHEKRPSPTDQLMEAAFNRTDEMVHRLALLLKLSSMEDIPGYFTEVPVDVVYFQQAIQMWNEVLQGVPETLKQAAATRESSDVNLVGALLQRVKKLDHSNLLRRVSHYGMNADRVQRALRELEGRQDVRLDVEAVGHGKTKRIYVWVGG